MPVARLEPDAQFQVLKDCSHAALAVSGGSDSMALLRLAASWRERQQQSLRLSVLTVDHGLRAESADEAREVGRWAAHAGLPHHILSWSPAKPVSGLQAKAREARYRLMTEWCHANGANMLLTAHTRNDQAETVLMRLARTTSPESLAGIPRLGAWRGTTVCRPLLDLRRSELRDYLRSIGQAWIEDPSNDDTRFERVRLRQKLGNDGDVERLAALAQTCARTVDLLQSCGSLWIGRWLVEEEQGICHAPCEEFSDLPEVLRIHILSRLIRHYGAAERRSEREELVRLARWLDEVAGPIRCTLGGAVIGKRKSSFWITREASRIDPNPAVIGNTGSLVWDNRFIISAPKGSLVSPAGSELEAWTEGQPVHARRACPAVRPPAGAAGGVKVQFLRLKRT